MGPRARKRWLNFQSSAVRVGEARQEGEGEPAQMGFKAAVPFVGMTMAECAQVGLMISSKAAMSNGMSNFVSLFLVLLSYLPLLSGYSLLLIVALYFDKVNSALATHSEHYPQGWDTVAGKSEVNGSSGLSAENSLSPGSWPLCSPNPLNVCSLAQVLSPGEGEERRKCICINPGRMAKGGGGSFAELNYQGSPYKDECFNYRH
ncbi:hypothetical protein Peur_055433 [Populus x canadensis]